MSLKKEILKHYYDFVTIPSRLTCEEYRKVLKVFAEELVKITNLMEDVLENLEQANLPADYNVQMFLRASAIQSIKKYMESVNEVERPFR